MLFLNEYEFSPLSVYLSTPPEGSGAGIKGGSSTPKPKQVHHYASDKSKTYTQSFKDITDKYGLDLDDVWNKELLPHQGRHPNAYHDFILDEMRNIDNVAQGNKDIFLDLYESEIKSIIREQPDMLYSNYWENLKE
ncbi:AHH domain-containing protein [Lacrimispora sp.]|uniref:AHH domain-containing protein n=1 Tax=Lacrimispora sp. TaxID=2719234 RepID=UPI0039E59F89